MFPVRAWLSKVASYWGFHSSCILEMISIPKGIWEYFPSLEKKCFSSSEDFLCENKKKIDNKSATWAWGKFSL